MKSTYPLLQTQFGVFAECMKYPKTTQYNIPSVTRLTQAVDTERLVNAIRTLYRERCELRIRFMMDENGSPLQYVSQDTSFTVSRKELSDKELDDYVRRVFIRPFDLLGDEPLFRAEIVKTESGSVLLIDVHHIIMDGTSLENLFLVRDMRAAYLGEKLEECAFGMTQLAEETAGSGSSERDRQYYLDRFEGKTLATLSSGAAGAAGRLIKESEFISIKETDEWCGKNGVPVDGLFQAAFCHVLSSFMRDDSVAYTMMVHGRFDKRIRDSYGMFVQTLPVMTSKDSNQTVLDFIGSCLKEKMMSIRHHGYPFAEFCRELDTAPGISFNFLAMEGSEEKLHLGDIILPLRQLEPEDVFSDLNVSVYRADDSYEIRATSSDALNDGAFLKTFAGAMADSLAFMMERPGSPLKDIPVVSPKKADEILELSTGEKLTTPADETWLDSFLRTVEKYPEKTAVSDQFGGMTYKELNRQSDIVASYLISNGVQPDDFVALKMDRVKEYVVAVTGTHKAGAAFLPIDLNYPESRISYMLENSGAKVVLSGDDVKKIVSDNADAQTAPVNKAIPSGNAYMIYTSGTTGRPKGAILHHEGLKNFTAAMIYYNGLTDSDRIAHHFSFSFDSHIEDVFPPLSVGASVFIMPESIRREPRKIYEFLIDNEITGCGFTTAIGKMIYKDFDLKQRYLSVCGEPLTDIVCRNTRLINKYGPTECVDIVSVFELQKDKVYKPMPIGRPMPNGYIFILDTDGRLLPRGITGEICYAGPQVGRGYQKLAEKTAEVFEDCPFVPGLRMYHTGDLGRYNEEGLLECFGRIDNQVKVRGFRIELGEIEAVAGHFEGIKIAAAAVRENNIVLFYQAKDGADIDETALNEHMSVLLADYMVPTVYVKLDDMPYTPSGKVDRRSLPEVDLGNLAMESAKTEMQKKLHALASEILKTDRFGVTDNLVSLGMSSISMMRFVAAVRKETGKDITVAEAFKAADIKSIEQLLESDEAASGQKVISVREKMETYPLTDNQKGIYIDWEMNKDTTQYNIPAVYVLENTDADRLAAAVKNVINEHEYLKTRIGYVNGELVQKRTQEDAFVQVIELDSEPDAGYFQQKVLPFDLLSDRLYRIEIAAFEGKAWLFIDVHHIIFDGISGNILIRDILSAYNGGQITKETVSAYDYALFEQDYDSSADYANAKDYFAKLLGSAEAVTYPASQKADGNGYGSVSARIPAKAAAEFCRTNGVTEAVFLQAAFAEALRRITRQEDACFAMVSNGRSKDVRLLQSVGMYVRTLPAMTGSDRGNDLTTAEYVKSVDDQIRNTISYELYPYTKLVEDYGIHTNVVFVYQDGTKESAQIPDVCQIALKNDTSKFDINVTVFPGDDDFEILVEYNANMYCQEDMQVFADATGIVAQSMAVKQYLREAALVCDAKIASILKMSEGETLEYDRTKTWIDLFTEYAGQQESKKAVIDMKSSFTYGELERASNAVAHYLVNKGIKENDFVIVKMDRVKEFTAAMIGIMKAGAAYVPIDPAYPEKRIALMEEDSGAKLVIDEQLYEDILKSSTDTSAINLSKPEASAYMIYTSGSTGRPKGVVQSHRSLLNFVSWRRDRLGVRNDGNYGQFNSFSFDGSLDDLVSPLAVGASVTIFDESLRKNIVDLCDYISKNKITGMSVPTQLGMELIDQYPDLSIEFLMMGGEKLLPFEKTAFKVINGYGPTEFTVCSSYHIVGQGEENIPIGRPVPNTASYILDMYGNLLPAGVTGELCLAGAQLANGYYNQPGLTANVFKDVVINGRSVKVYRTGDLARYNRQGELEYAGRIDDQIKLRGYRVEYGEIESRANLYPEIEQAVAAVKQGRLVLYYTSSQTINEEGLRGFLAESLAEYMVPSVFMRIEKIPVTPGGKINRKKLPEPELAGSAQYEAPRGEAERNVCEAMAMALGISSPIGALDSFFELGGDSIKAIRMVSRLRQKGLNISVSDIMKGRTVRHIAAAANNASKAAPADKGPVSGELKDPAIFAYFKSLELPKKEHFNQSVLLRLTEKCDPQILRKAVEAVTYQHDMLRAVVRDGHLYVRPAGTQAGMTFNTVGNVNTADVISRIGSACAALQESFDLSEALVKFAFFEAGEEQYLFIVAHHLVIDGVSWRILIPDLECAYRNIACKGEADLPEKTCSYRDYCDALTEYKDSYALSLEKPYWEKTVTKLPANPGSPARRMGRIIRRLDEEQTAALLKTGPARAGANMEDALLTALVRSINEVTGEKTVPVQMEGHGREKFADGLYLDRTIGWFTSVYPVVFEIKGTDPVNDLIEVKETLRRVPGRGAGYAVLRYAEGDEGLAAPERKAEIGFNYLGDMTVSTTGDGLFAVERDIDTGEDIAPSNIPAFGQALTVNCDITNGCFSLSLDYDTDFAGDEKAALIADGMIAGMKELKDALDAVKEPVITASDLGETEWSNEEFKAVLDDFASRGEKIERIYPLLPMQEGMLLEHLKNPEGWAYRLVSVYELDCMPEEEQLKAAVRRLTGKHEVLRTALIHDGVSSARQAVVTRQPAVETVSLRAYGTTEEEAVRRLREEILTNGFDLQRKPLFRIVCAKKENGCYILMAAHHVIVDGWCGEIYRNDFFRFLAEEMTGGYTKDGAVQSGRYEAAVREILAKDRRKALDYWRELLSGYDTGVGIPSWGEIPEKERSDTDIVYISLDEKTTERYGDVCRQEQATMSNGAELAWGLVLETVSRRNDAVFAKVVSGRDNTGSDVNDLVGLFINSVPVRVTTDKDDTLRTSLRKLRDQAASTSANDFSPLSDIQQVSELGSQLVSGVFVFENYSENLTPEEGKGLPFGVKTVIMREEPFDDVEPCTFVMDGRLYLRLTFNRSRYRKAEMERILELFATLVEGMAKNPDAPISSLPLLNDGAREKILAMSAGPKAEYHLEKTWLDLFLARVGEQPGHLAVEDAQGSLTYSQLDRASDKMASWLIGKGIKPDDFVVIKMHRHKEFAVAVIGVQKAGACYIPIDPNYPSDRISYMIEDSRADVVLDDELIADILRDAPESDPVNLASPANLAYTIYTSGSTGRPKGTMISHRALKNYTEFYIRRFGVTPDDRLSHHITFSFDSHIRDFYPALAAGASLHFMPDDIVKEPDEIYAFLEEKGITGSAYATAMGQLLINNYDLKQRFISIGGESIRGLRTGLGRVFNVCGATEVTDVVVDYELEKCRYYESVPVGRPMANCHAFILDASGRLLPEGVAGEICYAGPNVGEGYWNKKEETQKVFVECPFVPGERMYHTGDLGRYNEDGQVEYLGRIDFQVKLRGYRIELGEVESRAVQYAGIKQAVANVRDEKLVLYFTADAAVDFEDLKAFMGQTLTDYMVPSVLCQLDALPMTPSGKVDRKNLPDVTMSQEEIIMPENETERRIYLIVCRFLPREDVGVNTNLMSAGMTSLMAMRINAALSVELGMKLRVADILKNPVIRELARLASDTGDAPEQIRHGEDRRYYPMTGNQRGIYIDWEMNKETTQYNTPNVYVFTDKDAQRLAAAVQKTVDAHGYLKTRLAVTEDAADPADRIVQEAHPGESCEVEVRTLEERPGKDFFQKLVRPFDLFNDKLYRITVYAFGNETYLFTDIHHIIFDGLSNDLFLREVLAAYEGKEPAGESITAFDYALYEQEYLNGSDADEAQEYFDGLLEGADHTVYPASKKPSLGADAEGNVCSVSHKVSREGIDAFCRRQNITPGSFMHAAFAEALKSLTRDDRPMYVTVSNGRGADARLLGSMGMYVKTLPVVYPGELKDHAGETVTGYAAKMHEQLSRTYGAEMYPYTRIVEKHKLHAQIMFAYQGGLYGDGEIKMPGTMELSLDTVKFPVLATVSPKGDSYVITVEYDGHRYGREDMQNLADAVMNAALTMTVCGTMGEISFVTPGQKEELIRLGTGKEAYIDPQETIVSMFRERAAKTPGATAVVFKDRSLTYREADELSDRIALYLAKEYGLGAGDIAGILIRRSEWMLVYPLAVMKTGAAYMPLDPGFPTERLELMCADAGAKMLLSEGDLPQEKLPAFSGGVFRKEQSDSLPECGREDMGLIAGPGQEDRLTVLYTSGSTGKPKGVELAHRGIVNYCHWYVEESGMTEEDHAAGFANFGFDAHMIDMYPTVLAGGAVYIFDEELRMDVFSMNRYMTDNRITVAFLTTQIGCIIKDMKNTLRCLFTGGESMPALDAPGYKFYNVYGPTECSLFSTYHRIYDRFEDNYIGLPLTNYRLYVADFCGRLLPRGAEGELLIAGMGVGIGYLNSPELTAEKFIDFEGTRAYRSGDLVRWAGNGAIEYIGRNDNQVKLRGLRIELGEIEKKILDMDSVSQAVVEVRGTQSRRLVCYYTSEEEISPETFREKLEKDLASYMIPEVYVRMPRFVLNANGKIDRKVLPEPEIKTSAEYVEPSTKTEKAVAAAMARILGISGRISAADSFYALGGDSIKAIRLVSLLREKDIRISVAQIMKLKTVAGIAAEAASGKEQLQSQEPEEGEVEETAIIRFYRDLKLKDEHHLIQAMAYRLKDKAEQDRPQSSPEQLNQAGSPDTGASLHDGLKGTDGAAYSVRDKLQTALDAVTAQHDMLRAVIKDGKLYARGIEAKIEVEEYEAASEKEASDIFTKIKKNIDMSAALLRVALIHANGDDYLCMAAHHLIIDGVSWRILSSDLERAYGAALEGKEINLPAKTSSYPAYAEKLKEYRNDYRLEREIPYWNKVWERVIKAGTCEMKDYARSFGSKTASLDPVHTTSFMQANRAHLNLNINEFLLTALGRAYSLVMKKDEISIQLEGHGREDFSDELVLDRTVGWFTSIYPVVFEHFHNGSNERADLQADLIQVKETLRRIPNKGAGFIILRYLEGDKEAGYSKDIAPQIGFNFLGEIDAEQNADGLFSSEGTEVFDAKEEREHAYGPDLDINCAVRNGCFVLNAAYNENRYESGDIESLINTLFDEIEKLTYHLNFGHIPVLTASDLGENEWSEEEFRRVYEDFAARKEKIVRIYPLLPMQEGMLFKHISEPESSAYRLVSIYELKTVPSEDVLKETMEALGSKYEVLRTAFVYEGVSAARQVITDRKLPYGIIDLSGEEDPYAAVIKLREKILSDGFDIERDPLFKVICAKKDDESSFIMIAAHHMIVDGWSQQNYLADLFGALLGRRIRQEESLDGLYESHVRHVLGLDRNAGLDYFRELLKGYETKAQIPEAAGVIPEDARDGGDELRISVDAKTTDKLAAVCKEEKATLSNAVELLWGLVLQTYSHTQDAVFGKVVSGRDKTETDMGRVTGLFINSVPVRVKTDPNVTGRQMLARLQQQATATNEYDFCPLPEIQKQSSLGSDLMQTVIAFQNYNSGLAETKADSDGRRSVKPVLLREETFSGLNVTTALTDDGELMLNIIFDREHFRKQDIERAMELFRLLAEEIAEEPDRAVGSLPRLSHGDTEKICALSRGETMPVDEDKTWVDLFTEAAANDPGQTAVADAGGTVTYGELDAWSDSVASMLVQKGAQPGSFVAVKTGRSREFVAAMIGVMKAGAAYVPVDPEYPADRIRYMLDDSGALAVLTEEEIREALNSSPDAQGINRAERKSRAYMIYTSGSTGNPKGVVQSHDSLYHFVSWRIRKLGIKKGGNYGHFTSFAFDASLDDLACPLAAGAAVHIFSEEQRHDLEKLVEYIEGHEINGLTMSTRMGMELIRMKPELKLDYLMMGGEKLLPGKKTSYKVINGYGPTEFTVCSSYYVVEGNEEDIPIGRPVPNTAGYICDCYGNLVPRGVAGELCLAGPQMAEGYWKLPQMTNDTFVTADILGEQVRLYKTGDLARYNEDGELEYAGRIDTQVKLRGYRIEFGEIETRARKHPLVEQAAANVYKDQLVLYYTTVRQDTADTLEFEDGLHDFIAETVTDYMVPTIYMRVDEIPFTPNGKVDRKALPEPELLRSEAYEEPENEFERLIAEGMREVLELDAKVGALDKFYALGGDSIKVIRLISLLGTKGISLKVSDFKKYQTVRAIAQAASERDAKDSTPGEAVEGEIADSAIIAFFKDLGMPDEADFTQDVFLRMNRPADTEKLQKALDCLTVQHDLLRAVWKDGHLYVRNENTRIGIEEYNLSDEGCDLSALCERIRGSIRMDEALFKAALIHDGEQDRLFLVAHHAIVDGVSWRIIIPDLEQAYGQVLKGMKPSLPGKTGSYRDYVQALEAYRESEALKAQIPYWNRVQKLVDEMPGSDMKDYGRRFANIRTGLDPDRTARILKADRNRIGLEMNDLLITALSRAYCAMEDTDRVSVQLEGHGREDITDDLSLDRTVGWFTSVFPVVVEGITVNDIRRDLITVKENLHRVPEKGVGYNVLRFMDGEEKTGYSSDRIAKLSFNYLGETGGSTAGNGAAGSGTATKDSLFSAESIQNGTENKNSNNNNDNNNSSTGTMTTGMFGSDLNVNCMVENGSFVLMISYNTDMYASDRAEEFARAFISELELEADFLGGLKTSIVTAVDMGVDVWSEEKFERIWDHFEDKGEKISSIKAPKETEEQVLEKRREASGFMAYECPGIYHVSYCPTREELDSILERLASRFEVLRTSFETEGSTAMAIVTDRTLHAQMLAPDEGKDAFTCLKELRDELTGRNVDLMEDDLIRCICVPGTGDDCHMLIAVHPIVSIGSELSDMLVAAKCLAYLAEETGRNFRIDDLLRDRPMQEIYRNGIRICGLENEYDPAKITVLFPWGIILRKSVVNHIEAMKDRFNLVMFDTINLHFHELFDGETYDDIVNYYMTLLEFMVPQPNRIFCCFGYSFGGEVAFGMATRIAKSRGCRPIIILGDSDLIPCLGVNFERKASSEDLDPMLKESLNFHGIPQESMIFAYNMLGYLNSRKKTLELYEGKTILWLAIKNNTPQTIAMRKQLASSVAGNLEIIEFPDKDHFTLISDTDMAQTSVEMIEKLYKEGIE